MAGDSERCGICFCQVSVGENDEKPPARRFFAESRLICRPCQEYFDPNFTPTHVICVNPLCKRKWKLLCPQVFPHFCPPCRRHLLSEKGRALGNDDCEISVEKMYRRWHIVWIEIAALLGIPTSQEPVDFNFSWPQDGSQQSAILCRCQWKQIVNIFQQASLQAPPIANVRNWNSVHGRRKHYSGQVVLHGRALCGVSGNYEVDEETRSVRRHCAQPKVFYFVDWMGTFQVNSPIVFATFPNPDICDRSIFMKFVHPCDPTGLELRNEAQPERLESIPGTSFAVVSRRQQRRNKKRNGEPKLAIANVDDFPLKESMPPTPAHLWPPTPWAAQEHADLHIYRSQINYFNSTSGDLMAPQPHSNHNAPASGWNAQAHPALTTNFPVNYQTQPAVTLDGYSYPHLSMPSVFKPDKEPRPILNMLNGGDCQQDRSCGHRPAWNMRGVDELEAVPEDELKIDSNLNPQRRQVRTKVREQKPPPLGNMGDFNMMMPFSPSGGPPKSPFARYFGD